MYTFMDLPNIRFRLAGHPANFYHAVPVLDLAKMLNSTRYGNQIFTVSITALERECQNLVSTKSLVKAGPHIRAHG